MTDECTIPPAGWRCTRAPGHEGPCAAVPDTQGTEPSDATKRMAKTLGAKWAHNPKWERKQPDTDGLAKQAIMSVLDAVRDYLPPDGISKDECLNRVIEAVDNPTINPVIREIENGRA